jgi:hypothetical protein
MSALSHIDRRLSLRPSDSFIIDPIFPNASLHVINGPPDIGKSTWLFDLLYNWELGKAVLGGCRSLPCDWVYISFDRGLRDTDRTLRRIGLDHWNMPAYAIEDLIDKNAQGKIDLEPNIFAVVKKFPNCQLYVIEGLQMLMPNVARGQSLNKAQAMWVVKLRHEILNAGKTIIAVNHMPKGNMAAHDREAGMGSQGLIGGLGTTVNFGLPPDEHGKEQGMLGQNQCMQRLVSIMPKNSPKVYLTYSVGDHGRLELEAAQKQEYNESAGKTVTTGEVFDTPSDIRRILDMHLNVYEGQAELTERQVLKWAADANIATALAKDWVKMQVRDGRLVREGGGNFRRTSVQ